MVEGGYEGKGEMKDNCGGKIELGYGGRKMMKIYVNAHTHTHLQ